MQHNQSEDVNCNRHLKNALALNKIEIEPILTAFYSIIREQPFGVKSSELSELIQNKTGKQFSFKEFGCHSMFEFLKKFIMQTIDLEIIASDPMHQDDFILRNKEFYKHYNIQPQSEVVSKPKVVPEEKKEEKPTE